MMFFCGCAREDSGLQKALDLRSLLLSRGQYGFSVDVTCDYGESVFAFSADCITQEDGVRIRLTQPETLSGIEAFCGREDVGILFDDTLVSLGKLADGNLAPLQAPYLFRKALESEYISCTGRDADALRVTYLLGYDDEELQLDVWLDEKNNLPLRAEITYEGRSVLRALITDFTT